MSAEERRNNKGINILFINITWIIIHLGINPVKGGNPPKDRRLRGIVRDINKEEWLGFNKSEIEFDWIKYKKRTTEEEIKA